ncbi:MAG: hypothetical protein FVQ84_07305 [Planctomycetes bacterium]|jgi:predicted DNA-binding transcriptional regulator AlpA|nr:hypothetical protein [Planctomycetota bacterium]
MSKIGEFDPKVLEKLLLSKHGLIDAKVLATLLCVSKRSIDRYTSLCLLPKSVKIGGSRRWRIADIELFIESGCNLAEFQTRKEQERC